MVLSRAKQKSCRWWVACPAEACSRDIPESMPPMNGLLLLGGMGLGFLPSGLSRAEVCRVRRDPGRCCAWLGLWDCAPLEIRSIRAIRVTAADGRWHAADWPLIYHPFARAHTMHCRAVLPLALVERIPCDRFASVIEEHASANSRRSARSMKKE